MGQGVGKAVGNMLYRRASVTALDERSSGFNL